MIALEWEAAEPPGAERPGVYVHPGQLHVTGESVQITTILGSCVAVCLFDAMVRIGGLAHFVMPRAEGVERSRLRFGNHAIAELIRRLVVAGARPRHLAAKLFGGACLTPAFRAGRIHLGQQNADEALSRLAASSIPIHARDLGGDRGRKVLFHPDDGAAWVKTI